MRRVMLVGFLFTLAVDGSTQADDPVGVLFVREKGVGSAAQAQPYADQLGTLIAAKMRWSAVKIRYDTMREGALRSVPELKPRYAFLTPRTFLALRQDQRLEAIGRIEGWRAGGNHYHLVAKAGQTLESCKGKTLVSHHADDVRFVDNVVFGAAAKLSEFKLVSASRPIQVLKKVIANEAECALIDDGQLAELSRLEGGADIRPVWSSAELPSLIVAAFPSAPAADRKSFIDMLSALPQADGQEACKAMDIKQVRAASDADLKDVIEAYQR